jgi:hypothetical protein
VPTPPLDYVCRATYFFSDGTSHTLSSLNNSLYDLVIQGNTLAAERSLLQVGHRFVFVQVTATAPALRY